MVPITKISGRLGNQMFQYAFLHSYAKNHDLDQYFQDELFFADHAASIRQMFSMGIAEPTDAIALHVRRGKNPVNPDEPAYCDNPFYTDLMSTSYYIQAMTEFPEGTRFMVFSDDIEWCKKQELFKECLFFHEDEIADMNKMASCKAHIIANSSFSWWGAWLSPLYPNNKVIAPREWFSDGIERISLPVHWKRI